MDLLRFYPTPTKFGVDIVEWSMVNANVLDFRYVFALSNYGANCFRLDTKNCANFVFFSAPVCFRGHFEKIGIAKVLLGTKPRRVGKFNSWMSVLRPLRKCGEKNKKDGYRQLNVRQLGSLRPWDYRGKCYMDRKRIQCLSNASQHVPIYCIFNHFWDIASYWSKIATFLYPTSV